MSRRIEVPKGAKFNRWTVLNEIELKKELTGQVKRQFSCICECGTKKTVSLSHLRTNHSKSCGCLNSELLKKENFRHGLAESHLYKVYCKMKDRCYNKNSDKYVYYGGRGIRMCKEWCGPQGFVAFFKWNSSLPINEQWVRGLTIERVNVNKDYKPNNCAWVNRKTQANNRRSNVIVEYKNKAYSFKQFHSLFGIPEISYDTAIQRHRRGWKPINCVKQRLAKS